MNPRKKTIRIKLGDEHTLVSPPPKRNPLLEQARKLSEMSAQLDYQMVFNHYKNRIGEIVTVQNTMGNQRNQKHCMLLGEGEWFILPKKNQTSNSLEQQYLRVEIVEVKQAKGHPNREGYPWIIVSHKTQKAKDAEKTPIDYKLYRNF